MEKKLIQIPKKDLMKNMWYLGRGRNSNIGLWDGKRYFWCIGEKWYRAREKLEGYFYQEPGKLGGPFQPFMKLENNILDKGFVKKNDLINGKWYLGEGKNYVAFWFKGGFYNLPGKFYTFDSDNPFKGILSENFSENPFDGFSPYKPINEGKIQNVFDSDKRFYEIIKKAFPDSERCVHGKFLLIDVD